MVRSPHDTSQLPDALKLFEVFSQAYGWSDADIASALQIDEPALRSYVAGDRTLTATAQKAIADLQELAFFLQEIFSDGADAARWLNKTAPVLKGRSPIDLIRTGKLDKVISVLATFHTGAFL